MRCRTCPGYNVRVVLVIQTPAQLREVYGANERRNHAQEPGGAHRVCAQGRCADAREISDELGNTTVKVKTHSRAADGSVGIEGSRGSAASV